MAQLGKHINLEQLTDYYILQMYAANIDWISNNFSLFRPKKMANGDPVDPRWQFMLWDVEQTFGLTPTAAKHTNMFEWLYRETNFDSNIVLGEQLIESDASDSSVCSRMEPTVTLAKST